MTDEVKLYAVKNDEGKFYDFYSNGDFWKQALCRRLYTLSENEAQYVAHDYGGHVVELVEAPAKVVVSEKEADKLERAKVYGNPADVILALVANHHPDDAEHLLRAYVNGWTVEKPKRWNVKVPHTNCGWYFKCEDDENENPPILDELGCDTAGDPKNWDDSSYFTAAEIEHYGLQDCERVEVCADNARTTGEVTDDGE